MKKRSCSVRSPRLAVARLRLTPLIWRPPGPTPRHRRWSPRSTTGAASTSASTAAGGSSHKCWDIVTLGRRVRTRTKAVMTRLAASSAARSAIAGRRRLGVRRRSAGRLGRSQGLATPSLSSRRRPTNRQGRCLRPVHRPGRLRLEQRAAVREGRRRRHQRQATEPSRLPPAAVFDQRQRDPLGRHGRRRRRVRLRAELVGRLRIRPPVHGQPQHHLHHNGVQRSPARCSRTDIRQDVDMGTVRVNYRWGGPVIAKY